MKDNKSTSVLSVWQVSLAPNLSSKLKKSIDLKLLYINGKLDEVKNIQSAGLIAKKETLTIPLPLEESIIEELYSPLNKYYEVKRIPNSPIKDRIAAFCVAYKNQTEEQYKVSQMEAKRWNSASFQHVGADKDLLKFYMECNFFPLKGPKSILDYMRHYQATVQLFKKDKKGEFPDEFDKALMQRLAKDNPLKYQAYRVHLHDAGFIRKHSPSTGETWVKKQ